MGDYYIDTEFNEFPSPGLNDHFHAIELIALGIVDGAGRAFYRETRFRPANSNPWVRKHVWPALAVSPQDTFAHMAKPTARELGPQLLDWMGNDPAPVFWGYYGAYDWVAFCSCFGAMIDLPAHFPMYLRDLKQVLDERGNPPIPQSIKPLAGELHNALADANYHRRIRLWTTSTDAGAW